LDHPIRKGCQRLALGADDDDGDGGNDEGDEFHCQLPPTTEEVNAIVRDVCLSVCLLTRLLKNACMYLDEMLRVDRCRDMDELINF